MQTTPPSGAAGSKFSTQEAKKSLLTKRLQNGVNGVRGIMSRLDQNNEELRPYSHQVEAVEFAMLKPWALLAHDAGLGKTATTFQLFCAIWLLKGGDVQIIITAPKATLNQWESTAHDWLDLPDKRTTIFTTTCSSKLTQSVIENSKVIITTRHCIANCFKESFQWVKDLKKNATNQSVGGWDRKPNSPLHPIFRKKDGRPRFAMLAIDEGAPGRLKRDPWPCLPATTF